MNDLWLVDILPVHCPSNISDVPVSYRHIWETIVGPVTSGDGDREQWLEQAARLEAAFRWLDDPLIRIRGREQPIPNVMTLPHYGVLSNMPFADQLSLIGNANRYDRFHVLDTEYGRSVLRADCTPASIDQAIFDMRKQHPTSGIVVKFMAASKLMPLCFIDPDLTCMMISEETGEPYRTRFDSTAWLGWTGIRFDGEPSCILVQQRVRMRYEYRIHVIANHAVCGAGCIEQYTPADNQGARYDPRMQINRGNSPIETKPELANQYATYAQQIANKLAGQVTRPYVIDLYYGEDNQPHVLELNDQTNAGLYALDMDRLLQAVKTYPEEYTPHPADESSEIMEDTI